MDLLGKLRERLSDREMDELALLLEYQQGDSFTVIVEDPTTHEEVSRSVSALTQDEIAQGIPRVLIFDM